MKKIFTPLLFVFFFTSVIAEVDKCCPVPYDKEVFCDVLPTNFNPRDPYQLQSLFGRPKSHSGCNIYYVEELTPSVKLNSCNIGKIVRKFQVTPYSGDKYTCEQEVVIKGHHHYAIEFPKDASANCTVPQADVVKFHQFGCDLLTVNVNDEKFQSSGDECYKIFRTYRVINWCEFDDQNRRPIIIGRDEDCDEWPGDEAVFVIRKEDGTIFIDQDKESYNNTPPKSEINKDCGHDGFPGYWRSFSINDTEYYNKRGYFQYTQVLKVYDNTPPQLSVGAFDTFCSYQNEAPCSGPVSIPFSVVEECTQDDLQIQALLFENKSSQTTQNLSNSVVTGTFPNFSITGNFPVGEHDIQIIVTDACGSTASTKVPFTVKDCLASAPICLETLNAKVEAKYDDQQQLIGGYKDIWAIDFIASEVKSECSFPISYSIHRSIAIDSGEEVPNPSQASIRLNCDDLPVVLVYLYAWDAAGNHDRCQAYVWLQDDNFYCNSPYSHISGFVHTEQGEMVQNVAVEIAGSTSSMMMTKEDGAFAFRGLEPGLDYSIIPNKDEQSSNGVTTLDLVLISKHILGIEPLDSPYKLIAADINNSKTITTIDLINLRKIILRIDKSFQNNKSWRFVPESFTFSDPDKVFHQSFPETINLNNIDSSGVNENFVAIKVGDVSNDAITNASTLIALRSVHPDYYLTVDDQFFSEGKLVSVALDLAANTKIIGTQFTLEFDPNVLKFAQIKHSNWTNEFNFNIENIHEGWLTFSWFIPPGSDPSSIHSLFSIQFKARSSARIANILQITSQQTEALAYNQDEEPLNIKLQVNSLNNGVAELFQNTPNPFTQSTVIPFYLSTQGEAVISFYTIDGKMIHSKSKQYAAGHHQFNINNIESWPSGVIIYSLTTEEGTLSRKMIRE